MKLEYKCISSQTRSVLIGILLIPVLLSLLSMIGFATIGGVQKWYFPVVMLTVLGTVSACKLFTKWREALYIVLILLISVVIAGLPMMYTNADAETYHRAGTILLSNGWNPLEIHEVDSVKELLGGGFGGWHVSYLPRMPWIFGAALYKWFGFVEVVDAFNFLLLIGSWISVVAWIRSRLRIDGVINRILALVLCFPPVVINGMFGGSFDSGWYSALLIAIVSADMCWWPELILATAVMSGIKFTGVVVGATLFAIFGLIRMSHIKEYFIVGIVSGLMMLCANVSPYITNSLYHGSPFYPSHSFIKEERFNDAENPITKDFAVMNEDAKKLGYFGRLGWAYVSQNLVREYYKRTLDRCDFNPNFGVSGGVGGFGPMFRVIFVLSLFGWIFVRNKSINAILLFIAVTILMQPTFYCGYARYVPQLYIFPWLVALGLFDRRESGHHMWRYAQYVYWSIITACSLAVLAYPISFFALQWIISTQNLQILMSARNDSNAIICAPSLYSRTALVSDGGCIGKSTQEKRIADTELHPYSSYFANYTVYLRQQIPGFYDLHHVVSSNNESVKASRNKNNIRFFLTEFLKSESLRLPLRVYQTFQIRVNQLRRCF